MLEIVIIVGFSRNIDLQKSSGEAVNDSTKHCRVRLIPVTFMKDEFYYCHNKKNTYFHDILFKSKLK